MHSSNTQRAPARAAAAKAHRSKARILETSPAPAKQNLEEGDWTPTPNLYFKWTNKLDLIEIRIVSLFVRSTFGWHRERCRFSVEEIMKQVDRSKPPVIDALARLREKGIVGRSRISRQEAYEYWLVMRPEFRVVKPRAAPEHRQMPLRYDVHDFSSKETLTTGEVKKPLPLRGKETFTTEQPVLIVDLKKDRSIKTHTHAAPPSLPVEKAKPAAAPRVCVSKFSKSDLKRYARQEEWIENPIGWANRALKTGEWDDDVQEYFEAQERIARDEAAQAENFVNTLRDMKPRENGRRGTSKVHRSLAAAGRVAAKYRGLAKEPDSKFEMAIIEVDLVMSVEGLPLAEAIERLRDASPLPDASSEIEVWEALLIEIKTNLSSADSFVTWFEPIRFDGIDHTKRLIRLEAPNQAVRDWVKVNYSNLMDQSLCDAGVAGYSVYWTISGVNPAFQHVDEAFIQRVIEYFVKERGCEFKQTTAA